MLKTGMKRRKKLKKPSELLSFYSKKLNFRSLDGKNYEIGVDYIGVSVGALIFNDKGEVFLNKRSKHTRNEQGCWEAPCGAVDFGELRDDAIKREVKEEFGIDIEILRTLQISDEILTKYNQHWVVTTYIVKIKGNNKPKIMEPLKCDAIGWFMLDKLSKPLSYITTLDIKAYKQHLVNKTNT